MPSDETYVVAGSRSWNRRVFEERLRHLPGDWAYVDDPGVLTAEYLAAKNPRYVFFLHWSWIVPAQIVERHECVCFHMTDVPYGRGGSPLQNLIIRGHTSTRLTALRMVREVDAGPVYMKEDLSLAGRAEDILIRACEQSAGMIERIVRERPAPFPQEGPVVTFRRRTPEQSAIPALESADPLFDFLRMLDGEGYPPAFLVHEGFRYEFRRAERREGRIVAEVTISQEGRDGK